MSEHRRAAAGPCPVHPDCVRLAITLALGSGIVHLDRAQARSVSHQLYYAALHDGALQLDADLDLTGVTFTEGPRS